VFEIVRTLPFLDTKPFWASNSIREAFIEGTEPVEVATPKGAKAESQSDFFKEDIE
jgi:hypothetical protein